jgi:hypothetical protein
MNAEKMCLAVPFSAFIASLRFHCPRLLVPAPLRYELADSTRQVRIKVFPVL